MLPRQYRLSSDFDFRRLRREGRRTENPLLTLAVNFFPRRSPQFGFVVSARVSKLATKRNRIKRILRSEVYRLLPRIQPGTQAAFWVRPRALEAAPEELRKAVEDSLRRTGALSKE